MTQIYHFLLKSKVINLGHIILNQLEQNIEQTKSSQLAQEDSLSQNQSSHQEGFDPGNPVMPLLPEAEPTEHPEASADQEEPLKELKPEEAKMETKALPLPEIKVPVTNNPLKKTAVKPTVSKSAQVN